MANSTMPNMSDLRVQAMEVRDRREILNREMGRLAVEAVRFLNAMAAIVSHGGVAVLFGWEAMSFRIHMGEKGKFVVEFDLREHVEETRKYMDELGLDLRMTGYLYILNHAAEIARACTEKLQSRNVNLGEGITLIRSLVGVAEDSQNGGDPPSESLWGCSRRDGRPSAGRR